ncbi:Sua5/YciO/YrdC/YwlC family protein [Pasteurellaceae bacterium 22721_9_1]
MDILTLSQQLKANQVVAYPTEAVFGLGCNPFSQSAVEKLLVLKQRPIEKGLILVSPDVRFFLPFIDETRINAAQWQCLTQTYDHPITWVVPAKENVPTFLTGDFDSIAVRICRHPAVAQLCEACEFALTSTSANLSGLSPCRTAEEVRVQFGADFPVLDMPVGDAKNPSEIRDLLTNQLFRQG